MSVGRRLARRGVQAIAPLVVDRMPRWREAARRGLHIFTFHDVGDDPSPYEAQHGLCTAPEVFRAQVRWIVDHFDVIDPRVLATPDPVIADGAAVLTFDDGWAGTFEHGLPTLESLGLPSIVFLNTSCMLGEPDLSTAGSWLARRSGGPPAWPTPDRMPPVETLRELMADDDFRRYQGRFATLDEVAVWGAKEPVSLGSHLFHHWDVAGLDRGDLSKELARNDEVMRDLPGVLPLFAFPFGKVGVHFRDEHVTTVLDRGAVRAFTSEARSNPLPVSTLLDRISFTAGDRTHTAMWWNTHQHWLRSVLRRP